MVAGRLIHGKHTLEKRERRIPGFFFCRMTRVYRPRPPPPPPASESRRACTRCKGSGKTKREGRGIAISHKVLICTVYRAPQCMSPRRNWDSPNPSLASECAPPPRPKGERAHSPAAEVVGESDDWRKSLALCLLCGDSHCRYLSTLIRRRQKIQASS